MKLLRRIANLGYGSRKAVKAMFREGRVTDASGEVLYADDACLHEAVRIDGEPLDPPPGMVILMHKPVGVTCSHSDPGARIYDLLPERFELRRPPLSSVGRLDRDTSGLLLLTDDGLLLHRIISPRSQLGKVYRVGLARDLRGDEAEIFASGSLVLKGDKTPLAPADLHVTGPRSALVTLREGRYHQVRRMFAACGNHVETLHREAIGGLALGGLEPGDWRVLETTHVASIFT